MVITLLGEPKSTQNVYKMTCRGSFASMYMSKDGKDLKESYSWQAKSQWQKEPLTGEVYVGIKLYFGTKRRSDIDNFNKLLFDSLTGIVWVDDSQVQKMAIEKFYDKENPRIEISVYDYDKNYGKF